MVTFYLGGVAATPMVITDEKGNAGVIKTISARWAERLARVQTVEMGGSATVALYPSNGKQIKQNGIRGIVTLCEQVGLRIRDAHLDPAKALTEILEVTKVISFLKARSSMWLAELREASTLVILKLTALTIFRTSI